MRMSLLNLELFFDVRRYEKSDIFFCLYCALLSNAKKKKERDIPKSGVKPST